MNPLVRWIAVVMLSGCAAYQPRPLQPAMQMGAFERRALDSPELLRYVEAHLPRDRPSGFPRTWDLVSLSLAAFYFSPELDVARAQAAVSQAAIRTAGQRPNPSLQIPLEYTSDEASGQSPYTLGLGLDIPVETAGKRGYRVAQAQQLNDAARLRVGVVAWQLRSALRRHLVDLDAATLRAGILAQQVTAREHIVAMVDKREQLGAASAPEAATARSALLRARLALGNASRRMREQRARIAATIGVPVGAFEHIRVSFAGFANAYPAIPAERVRREAMLNRADLRALLAEYEASQFALQLEIARQVPDIHLGPGYRFDVGANKFLLPVSGISLPLLNRNEGPIAEAQARRREIASRFNAAQARAIVDVDRATGSYSNALKDLRVADALFAVQEHAWRSARHAFDAGETDRLTLTLAQSALQANELAREDARMDVERSIGDLEDAMQRPLSETGIGVPPVPPQQP